MAVTPVPGGMGDLSATTKSLIKARDALETAGGLDGRGPVVGMIHLGTGMAAALGMGALAWMLMPRRDPQHPQTFDRNTAVKDAGILSMAASTFVFLTAGIQLFHGDPKVALPHGVPSIYLLAVGAFAGGCFDTLVSSALDN